MNLYSLVLSAAAFTPAWLLIVRPAQAQNPALPAPGRRLAAQTSPTEITLTWKGSSSATEYVVFGPKKKTDLGGAGVKLGRISGTGTRYIARILAPGAEHRYAIQAVGKSGEISRRAKFNVVVPTGSDWTGVVSAPGSVQAKLTAPGEITLRWDSVPGATAYSIGRAVHPGGFGRLCDLCDPTRTKYVDRDVTAGQVHLYGVATVTPQGRSKVTKSNEVTPTGHSTPDAADTEDSDPPEKPGEVKAVVTSQHSIKLSWQAGEGATGYEISRRINNGEGRILVSTTEKTRYVDNQATADAKGALSYGVTSLNPNGRSEEVTIAVHYGDTTTGQPSKSAINLKAGTKSAGSVLLTWNGLQVGHSYSLRRRIGSALPVLIATITSTVTSFIDNVPFGIRDQVGYSIAELNGKGASNEALVTIDPAKAGSDSAGSKEPTDSSGVASKGPANPKAVRNLPLQIQVTWDQVAGATGYEIRRAIANGGFELVATVGPFVGLALAIIDALPINLPIDAPVRYGITALSPKGRSLETVVIASPFRSQEIDSAKSWSERTLPSTPGNLKATAESPNAIALTWSPLPGAASYEIRRSINNGAYQVVATVGGSVMRFVDQLPLAQFAAQPIRYTIRPVVPKGAASPEWTSNPITPDKGASEAITSGGRIQDADSIRPPRGRTQ